MHSQTEVFRVDPNSIKVTVRERASHAAADDGVTYSYLTIEINDESGAKQHEFTLFTTDGNKAEAWIDFRTKVMMAINEGAQEAKQRRLSNEAAKQYFGEEVAING
tara:strand:+ start:386 stop:703 length:318 start_codon:yes stop_codon:yes gene_type:complete